MRKIEIYSKEDTKTRKYWLLSLLIQVGLNWLGVIDALFETNQEGLSLQFAVAIVSTITSTMLYHFAYQKHGTRLLTWALIGPILGWLRVLGSFNKDAMKDTMSYLPFGDLVTASGFWEFLLILIPNGIYCWWYFLSYKLRKINKKIKFNNTLRIENTTQPKAIVSKKYKTKNANQEA